MMNQTDKNEVGSANMKGWKGGKDGVLKTKTEMVLHESIGENGIKVKIEMPRK